MDDTLSDLQDEYRALRRARREAYGYFYSFRIDGKINYENPSTNQLVLQFLASRGLITWDDVDTAIRADGLITEAAAPFLEEKSIIENRYKLLIDAEDDAVKRVSLRNRRGVEKSAVTRAQTAALAPLRAKMAASLERVATRAGPFHRTAPVEDIRGAIMRHLFMRFVQKKIETIERRMFNVIRKIKNTDRDRKERAVMHDLQRQLHNRRMRDQKHAGNPATLRRMAALFEQRIIKFDAEARHGFKKTRKKGAELATLRVKQGMPLPPGDADAIAELLGHINMWSVKGGLRALAPAGFDINTMPVTLDMLDAVREKVRQLLVKRYEDVAPISYWEDRLRALVESDRYIVGERPDLENMPVWGASNYEKDVVLDRAAAHARDRERREYQFTPDPLDEMPVDRVTIRKVMDKVNAFLRLVASVFLGGDEERLLEIVHYPFPAGSMEPRELYVMLTRRQPASSSSEEEGGSSDDDDLEEKSANVLKADRPELSEDEDELQAELEGVELFKTKLNQQSASLKASRKQFAEDDDEEDDEVRTLIPWEEEEKPLSDAALRRQQNAPVYREEEDEFDRRAREWARVPDTLSSGGGDDDALLVLSGDEDDESSGDPEYRRAQRGVTKLKKRGEDYDEQLRREEESLERRRALPTQAMDPEAFMQEQRRKQRLPDLSLQAQRAREALERAWRSDSESSEEDAEAKPPQGQKRDARGERVTMCIGCNVAAAVHLCGECLVAPYCSSECQTVHLARGHPCRRVK